MSYEGLRKTIFEHIYVNKTIYKYSYMTLFMYGLSSLRNSVSFSLLDCFVSCPELCSLSEMTHHCSNISIQIVFVPKITIVLVTDTYLQ